MLPVVLYGCEMWFLILREHRLRVPENRVLRIVFGPTREDVLGGWRKLHNLYPSENVITVIKSRKMRRVTHIAHMGRLQMHTKV
jgi:hypothetical protein